MRVLEIYQSKQGEGLWTGRFSVFIRLLGCPLRCRYCDTVYARDDSDEEMGADLSPDEIVGRVMLLDMHHVVITGGEPMVAEGIVELTQSLKEFDYQITIETSGIRYQPVLCDLISISPKLKNASPTDNEPALQQHNKNRSNFDTVQQLILRYNYQLKFVVDTPDDLQDIGEYLSQFHGVVPERVLLMPQAVDAASMAKKGEWIQPYCDANGYRYCPRMQLVWYGNKRRT
ncbi:MAG: 7-carboxy-7-deazaguanine synthase QueE [Planctomycetaceae bacterium]|nr:7-carboxy-7-deazaguanine synthase QueE [Planctomycetaceae bacterium]